ncbi:MAG: VIT domain-containing protein [Planctomycetaceae bacterium]
MAHRTLLLLALFGGLALAQGFDPALSASQVVIPQSRSWSFDRRAHPVRITGVDVRVRIVERTAATTMTVLLENPSDRVAEAVILLPVPDGAAVSAFDFQGAGSEPSARLLPRDEARRTYDEIVARLRDPALLEFAGYNLIRSSVFPVPPRGTQRVRLVYEQILPADGNRIDYTLPRSESLDARVPWRITIDVAMKAPVTVYSPTHELTVAPGGEAGKAALTVAGKDTIEAGPFLLSCVVQREEVAASLFAYPDPKVGGGYFLLFGGLPAGTPQRGAGESPIRREVTVVLDRSGSMAGVKMDQARAAALQVIEALEEGEAFNIIDYSTTVALFSEKPVIKSAETIRRARAYLASLRPVGGTNIHDALVEALRQPGTEGMLPLVLFLTDGLPTVGQTSELVIRESVEKGNPHRRRLFTFGVGSDVNAPLLDRLAEMTRATSAFVLPQEDVEVKVGQVFKRLYGPVLSDARLECLDREGKVTTVAVRELIPASVPDLFEGDQLVLLGQYQGTGPVVFRLSGNFRGAMRSFVFQFALESATTRNAFVPRLWAHRRIAYLIDQVRQLGAAFSVRPVPAGFDPMGDPRYRELVEEIVRLSTEFGILTEYTSFLALEGTDLADRKKLLDSCSVELNGKAVRERSGTAAVARSLSNNESKGQANLKKKQEYLDENMRSVEMSGVQQVCDRAYFRRGSQWVDARALTAAATPPDAVVEFGTEEFRRILGALVAEGRQATLALPGEILIRFEGKIVLIKNPTPE